MSHVCTCGDIFPSISQLNPFSGLALAQCNHRELFQGQAGICQQREPFHCWLGDGGTLQSFSAAANIAQLRPALGSQHPQGSLVTFSGTPVHLEWVQSVCPTANIPFSGVCTGDKSTPMPKCRHCENPFASPWDASLHIPPIAQQEPVPRPPQKPPESNSASPLGQGEAHSPRTGGSLPVGAEGAAAQPRMAASPKQTPHPLFTPLAPGYKTFLLKSFQIK